MIRGVLIAFFLASSMLVPAHAAEVGVIDFDGYDVPFETDGGFGGVVLIGQGLRDAFLAEGSYDPPDEFELSDRLTSGNEQELADARRKVSEARRLLDRGSPGSAAQELEQAISMHMAAGSHIVRRPEMADAEFFYGRALLTAGRTSEALEHFEEALRLFPGYPQHRAPNPSSEQLRLFGQANAGLLAAGAEPRPSAELESLAVALGVDAIVSGTVTAEGSIHARMVQDGTIVGEVRVETSEIPFPGDPFYDDLARELMSGAEIPSGAVVPVRSNNDDIVFDTDLTRAPVVAVPITSDPWEDASVAPPVTSEENDSRWSGRRTGKVKAGGRVRYGEPITRKWWFWTATSAVVVGGGATAIYFAMEEEDPVPDDVPGETTSEGYDVVVEL